MTSVVRQNPVRVSSNIVIFIVIFFSLALFSSATNDTISQGESIRDGQSSSRTLVSAGETFELGFFSPKNSTSRFVGIWYRNIPDRPVVWVANRARPIHDRTGVLRLGEDGDLVVLDGSNQSIWTSNASVVPNNSSARLSEDGNLILSNGKTGSAYWESFNNPTDTYLPGMRVEVSDAKGENRAFTSWKSSNDPSPGNFTMGVDPRGAPQIVIWDGENRRWRSGHWNMLVFSGVPDMTANLLYGFRLKDGDNNTKFFTYESLNGFHMLRFRIEWDGFEQQLKWDKDNKNWRILQSQPAPTNDCELYNKCGNFGVCRSWEWPKCRCMKGFQPTNFEEWSKGNWSLGCSKKTPFKCERNRNVTMEDGKEDGFVEEKMVKLPDFADLVPQFPSESCEDECLKNCNCKAYADINGIGCLVWTEDLLDVQQFQRGGNTLNIRLAHSDLGTVLTPFSYCYPLNI